MNHPTHPLTSWPLLPVRVFAAQRNRRRRHWPAILLSFILGLLAGWLLRGGGACLP